MLFFLGYLFGDTIPGSSTLVVSDSPRISQSPVKLEFSQISSGSGELIVTRVVDGDTITGNYNGNKVTVRMIGVDTPETVDPRRAVQCFGKEASAKTTELLAGQTVILKSDPTQGDVDKYNRALRYVFLQDGTHINELLIREGYAHEYTYQSKPYHYQEEFKAAEKIAREQKRGLWADGVCT